MNSMPWNLGMHHAPGHLRARTPARMHVHLMTSSYTYRGCASNQRLFLHGIDVGKIWVYSHTFAATSSDWAMRVVLEPLTKMRCVAAVMALYTQYAHCVCRFMRVRGCAKPFWSFRGSDVGKMWKLRRRRFYDRVCGTDIATMQAQQWYLPYIHAQTHVCTIYACLSSLSMNCIYNLDVSL